MRNRRHETGFTLVELLVVIGIIVLLAGLIFPQITKARKKAQRVECLNYLRQLGMAATEYIGEDPTHLFPWAGEDMTSTDHLNLLIAEGYVKEPKMFICPASSGKIPAPKNEEKTFTLTSRNNSTGWSGEPLSESDEPDRVLGCDGAVRGGEGDNNHPDGMNTLRIDGAVTWLQMKSEAKKKLPEGIVGP